ncbi:transposase [Pedobacter sp. AK017]|uniref:IS21 family transposase n=1 Tax=Pedobacter sp. AK017 TaxID=2723073 RepID=UPI00161B0F25|nr:IS21 family transposase [Pedobacter sp. AK017]MBB5441395.1 transposase [Pedobacter sp. AK017]
MWYKVKELFETGLNISQIRKETGLDRGTIRRYLNMDEQSFHEWIKRPRRLPKKLAQYHTFVRKRLENQPYLSSAQIEDKLKEHFPDLPLVHSKTIYNFVKSIREQYKLPKDTEKAPRDYQKLPETPYGEQAQADFGQGFVQTAAGTRVKVYFFAIVLSRSRQKYIYFQDFPFTTATAIYAHELAFDYFKGIPKQILYDQDRVFMKSENLGDLLLTDGFRAFCASNPFKEVFCRKADPESKGKVENVVKYVKGNFMRGREFKSIGLFQQECEAWLKRTGNGKVHSGTSKVPAKEWAIERKHLLPLTSAPAKPTQAWPEYIVRKDNCVVYKGSYYSLPSGTYKGQGTKVLLEVKGNSLCIYNVAKERVVQHVISTQRGTFVRCEGHKRRISNGMQETERQLLELLKHPRAEDYLLMIKQDKPRYYRDNLKVMLRAATGCHERFIHQTVDMCLDKNIRNGNEFASILEIHRKQDPMFYSYDAAGIVTRTAAYIDQDMTPEISNINFYDSLFN